MTPQEQQEFERRRAEYHDPFAFVPVDVCVIAFFSPGFCYNLSSWKLTLSRSGILVQDIILCRSPRFERQKQQDTQDVGVEFVQHVLNRADELNFWNLKLVREGGVTDMPSLRILIRHGTKFRDYAPEAVSYHAYQDENARRFMELWNLIHEHALFPKRAL